MTTWSENMRMAVLDNLSTSYPFLDLSRRVGARYGAVLTFADVLSRSDSHALTDLAENPHYRQAALELSQSDRALVADVVKMESQRRWAVSGGNAR